MRGANRHDKKRVGRTLNNLMAKRLSWMGQVLCLNKGYDYPDVRERVAFWGYTARIVARGVERRARKRIPGYRARRWVVERTHSRINRFRRLLVRWEKKADNYAAMLHLACAYITLSAAVVMG